MIRLVLFCLVLVGCASTQFTQEDVDYFQPPIVVDKAPERPITNYSIYNNTTKVNLAPMKAIIPAFNGKGNLLASWSPHPKGSQGRPTFVFVHGGHGLIPGDFATESNYDRNKRYQARVRYILQKTAIFFQAA